LRSTENAALREML